MSGRIGLMFVVVSCALAAQTSGGSLGGLVLSEAPALSSNPDLRVWQDLHPGERLKPAAYD